MFAPDVNPADLAPEEVCSLASYLDRTLRNQNAIVRGLELDHACTHTSFGILDLHGLDRSVVLPRERHELQKMRSRRHHLLSSRTRRAMLGLRA